MGKDTQILSFGKSRVYDSLALEFQTYNIRELAQSKAGGFNDSVEGCKGGSGIYMVGERAILFE